MAQHEYRMGERIHFYLPTDNPQHVRPRMGIIIEMLGISLPGAQVYAVAREEHSVGIYGEHVVALPAKVGDRGAARSA